MNIENILIKYDFYILCIMTIISIVGLYYHNIFGEIIGVAVFVTSLMWTITGIGFIMCYFRGRC